MTVQEMRPAFDLADPRTFVLDLNVQRPKEVLAIVEIFDNDIKTDHDLGKLPVKTGWVQITPAIAVNLLRRNRPGANRKIDPATVFYYAHQMAKGDWKATGQPVLIDSNGTLLDAQHRLYGVLISGKTIKSYVVADVEPQMNLFAYIDNSRVRTPAAALQTAGFDGVAPIIVKVIKIAQEIKYGVYNPSGATKLMRMSPADVLLLSNDYPNIQKAARSAASDWSDAVSYLGGHKETIAYLGMRIIDLHSEDIADDFFEDIMSKEVRAADDPIVALRKLIDKDNVAENSYEKASSPSGADQDLQCMAKTRTAATSVDASGYRGFPGA